MRTDLPGAEEILQIADPTAHLTAFIVIHSTRLGPAHGGIRVRPYPRERDALMDALDLGEAMTVKAALAGLSCGGGKIVVMDRRDLDRPRAMRAIARALEDLNGRFFAGPDYGLRPDDLARLRRSTRHVAADRPGRAGSLADWTARGAVAGIGAALSFSGWRRMRGASIAVEGLGAVGVAIVERLVRLGAIVTAADPLPAAARRGASLGARIVTSSRLASIGADVFVPAAVGGTIDERFARRCRVKVICGPANNVLATPAAEQALRDRNVLFVPDAAVSAGAVIAGVLARDGRRVDPGPHVDRTALTVRRILRQSARTGLGTTLIARRMAARRLRRGRWHTEGR